MRFKAWLETLELSSGGYQPIAYQLAQRGDTRAQQQHDQKIQAVNEIKTAINELQKVSAVTPQQRQIQVNMISQRVNKAYNILQSLFAKVPEAADLMKNLGGAITQWNQSMQYGNVPNLISGLNYVLSILKNHELTSSV